MFKIKEDALSAIQCSQQKAYVYIIRKPAVMKDEWSHIYPSGTPFYVGKGTGRRIREHENQAESYSGPAYPPPATVNLHKIHTIQEIWKCGRQPEYDLEFCEHERAAIERECELIKQIGRRDLGTGPLTNMTAGGDGLIAPSAEIRRRIGSATKKRLSDPENLARHSLERKEYFSKPEHRAKQSRAIRKAYEADPNLRQKNQERQKIAQNRPEVAAKKSAPMKEKWADPEWAAMVRQRQSEGWTSEKVEAKRLRNKSWRLREPDRWETSRAKQREAVNSPEYRRRRSELARQQHQADPNLRLKMQEGRLRPEAKAKHQASRAKTMERRKAINKRCDALLKEIENRGLKAPHAPDGRASVERWGDYEKDLMRLVQQCSAKDRP